MIFYLKNVAQWTDGRQVTSNPEAPLQIQVVSYGSRDHVQPDGPPDVQVVSFRDKYGKEVVIEKPDNGPNMDEDLDE